MAYPHTSNWDFITAMTARWAIGMPHHLLGQGLVVPHSICSALAALPGRRAGGAQLRHRAWWARWCNACTGRASEDRFLWLALAPEGTRALRDAWRSGFHAVAVQADVPLAVAFMDYRAKRVGMQAYLQLSGDEPADMAAIAHHLEGVQGKHPELATPIRLRT